MWETILLIAVILANLETDCRDVSEGNLDTILCILKAVIKGLSSAELGD